MGVSLRVADGLRADGHDVQHLGELGMNELADSLIFERGIGTDRVIATFDLDFS
jgi:predicted nuclease of predicted toxin-antitoxin system